MRSSKSPCIATCLCMLRMHGAVLIWLKLSLALPNLLIWLEMARFGVSLAAPPTVTAPSSLYWVTVAWNTCSSVLGDWDHSATRAQ